MARKRGAQHQLRIIGGKWKGRKVAFSGDDSLRPTLGKVRETLFNWIRAEVQGAQVLDAFAGSGALGLEALSQGAAHVTFVERNRRSCGALNEALAMLQAQHCATVLCSDTGSALQRCRGSFDIAFLDPPYSRPDLLRNALSQLSGGLLTQHGLVYAEFGRLASLEEAAANSGFEIFKVTRAGETDAVLMRPIAGNVQQR